MGFKCCIGAETQRNTETHRSRFEHHFAPYLQQKWRCPEGGLVSDKSWFWSTWHVKRVSDISFNEGCEPKFRNFRANSTCAKMKLMYDFFYILCKGKRKPRKNLQVYGALLWGNIVDGRDRSAAGRLPCRLNLRRSAQISGLGFCSCLGCAMRQLAILQFWVLFKK